MHHHHRNQHHPRLYSTLETQLLTRTGISKHHRRKSKTTKKKTCCCCNNKFKIFVIVFLIVLVFIAIFSLVVIFLIVKPFNYSSASIETDGKTTPVPIEVDSKECGLSAYRSDVDLDALLLPPQRRRKRIIKGEEAVPHSFPWLISLRSIKSKKISTHICTGAIIHGDYVLTAAHCVSNYTANELIVLVGLHSLGDARLDNIYLVDKLWSHESFDRNSQISHDIALLKLAKPIARSFKVSIACFSNYDPKNELVVVAGWGSVSDGFQTVTAKKLQQTVLSVLSVKDSRCRIRGPWDSNSTFCVLDLGYKSFEDLSNTCFGDSGAPIMGYKAGRWYIYGLVSYVTIELNLEKKKRCLPYHPSYSTRISTYYSWIMAKMNLTV